MIPPARPSPKSPFPGSLSGLPLSLAAALATLLPPLSGVLVLLLETQKRPLVRFHALQNILLGFLGILIFGALILCAGLFSAAPAAGSLFATAALIVAAITGLILLAFYTFALLSALLGKDWPPPCIGAIARQTAAQTTNPPR